MLDLNMNLWTLVVPGASLAYNDKKPDKFKPEKDINFIFEVILC